MKVTVFLEGSLILARLLPKLIYLAVTAAWRAIRKYHSSMVTPMMSRQGKNSIYQGVTKGARYSTEKGRSLTLTCYRGTTFLVAVM